MAQAETPPILVRNSTSSSIPSHFARAPVATMSASAVMSPTLVLRTKGGSREPPKLTDPVTNCVPKRSACLRMPSISSGPRMPFGKAGIVVDLGGEHELAARDVGGIVVPAPFDDQGLELGARGVDGRGEARGPGSEDDDLVMILR